jgi:hypothetical protein
MYIHININLFFYFFDCTYLFGDHVTEALYCQWPGYRDWSSQIIMRDQTTAYNTIILDKFAKHIVNAVGRFLDVSSTKYSPPLEPLKFLWSPMLFNHLDILDVLIGVGGQATSRATSKLADQCWRDHEAGYHPYWGCACLPGELAANSTTKSLCDTAMPAHPWFTLVRLQIKYVSIGLQVETKNQMHIG